MSILNRLVRHRHLDDAALAEIWAGAAADGSAPDRRDQRLEACAECRSRYDAFGAWMSNLRDEAAAEADEAFPPERLAAQQAQIARRLEALERPARIIAFPRFTRPVTNTHRGPLRWVAAAAAAGLIVGLVAGQLLELPRLLNHPDSIRTDARIAQPAPAARGAVQPVGSSNTFDDDAFMQDLEVALSSRAVPGLRAIEAMTPRGADYVPPR